MVVIVETLLFGTRNGGLTFRVARDPPTRGRHPDEAVATVLARCLQHEADHLDGLVFVDRLTARDRKRLLAAAELPGRPR